MRNEEILLPSWLTHHKKLFTHGVIVDNDSCDRSVEIIKEFCPTWEVVQVKTHRNLDIEKMQELESKYDGWKCVLNVSEFLVIDDLERYLREFEKNHPDHVGVQCSGIVISDRPGEHSLEQFKNLNLILTKDFGRREEGTNVSCESFSPGAKSFQLGDPNAVYRRRIIHKSKTGEYGPGRHTTRLNVFYDKDIFISYLGRGLPELYVEKCKGWNKTTSSYFLHNSHYYGEFSNKTHAYNYYNWDVKYSGNLFEMVPIYKQHLDRLYSNTSESS